MKAGIIFLISAINIISYFGEDNVCNRCCEKCCENCRIFGGKKHYDIDVEAEIFVNGDWLKAKKSLVLKLFDKQNENNYKSKKGNIQIELEGTDGIFNIKNQTQIEDVLKLSTKKWALFEIKYNTKEKKEETAYLYCSDIENAYRGIFESNEDLLSISVLVCDTSDVANVSSMFYDCSSLTELNISKFNTSKVTNMYGVFFNCSSLTTLNISKFNTSNVTGMGSMFDGCNKLQQVTVSEQAKDTILIILGKENFNADKNDNDTWILTRKK